MQGLLFFVVTAPKLSKPLPDALPLSDGIEGVTSKGATYNLEKAMSP